MSSKSIVEQIKHYQKDIERCPDNSERMIRCIQRLFVLPVLVQHLQETGVGRSVNSLRKFNGEVGEAAKALVAKWKAMVAAEESDDDTPVKPMDSDRNTPNSQSSVIPSTLPKEKTNSTSNSKNADSGKSSSHKRSHSSSSMDVKSEKKLTTSSSEMLKKNKSDDNSQHRHSSKNKEPKHRSEQHHSRTSDNHRVKSESRHKNDDKDHSPVPKKKKKMCIKERRKLQQTRDSEDEESSGDDSDVSSGSDRSHSGLSLTGENYESDSHQEKSSIEEESSDVDEDAQNASGSESDHKWSGSGSSRRSHDTKHRNSNSSSRSPSGKHRHSHHKDERKDHKKSSSTSSSKDLQKLIKENEKSIKKEKSPTMAPPSSVSSPKLKNSSSSSSSSKHKDKTAKVKIETNDDGSIDAGSGCSFADALAGLDSAPKKKKKPPTKEEQTIEKPSVSSSSRNSSSESSHSLKHKSSSKSLSSSSTSSKDRSSSSSSSSKKNKSFDTSMPELLKKPIKIENLELDINSTLPEINLNYRPLPHVPEPLRRNSTKSVTNEEEMFNMMMNKNQRTKVFSGGKSSFQQQVPSLYELCIKLLYDHIDGLEYTGGVPYDLLKPLLDKLNPDQLFVLEHYNPYLIEDTGTLWEFHCKKDFRSQKRQDMESWRDLYIRCMEEREEKLKALTQNITQSIAQSTPVRKVKLAYVDSAVKPPRNIAKKQARYGTGNGESSGISPALKSNMVEKREILNKAIVGSQNGSVLATVTVPPPPPSSAPRSSNWSTPAPANIKKRKAPLMAKALQLIKGTNRFKR